MKGALPALSLRLELVLAAALLPGPSVAAPGASDPIPVASYPSGPVAIRCGETRELVLQLGALPARPSVRLELVSGKTARELEAGVDFEIVECHRGDDLDDTVSVFDLAGLYRQDGLASFAEREGVSCRVRYTCPASRKGCCKLRIRGETAIPNVQSCSVCAGETGDCGSNLESDPLVLDVDQSCTTGTIGSFDFQSEGQGFRWLDDGSRRTSGVCELDSSGFGEAGVAYIPSDDAADGWDCCTWRLRGADDVPSHVGQLVFRKNGPPPPPDGDDDGILDPCDNCRNDANGPQKGSCIAGKIGTRCASDAACGTGGRCSMDQEDRNEDGQGDVCTSPAVWKCAGAQLTAAATLCKAQLACEAAFVTGGDPAKRSDCLASAAAAYSAAHAKASSAAARAGAVCSLAAEPAAFLSASFADPIHALAGAVRDGVDSASAGDLAQRAALLQAAGTLCASALKAEGASALKEDLGKLAAARAAARTKFDADAQKALAKGGGSYDGLAPGEIRGRADAIVDDFEELAIQGL